MVKKGINGKTSKTCCNDKENRPLGNPSGNDLDKILDFIEGRTQVELAPKKADKRARQRQKKEEERRKREEEAEAAQKAEEERLERERVVAERMRIKEELALQKTLKQKKKQLSTNEAKGRKTKKGKSDSPTESNFHFEQTIPAMVTIKRIVENNNAPPTVTITLKGSTPDQDKLLYTLVNGHDSPFLNACTKDEKTATTKTKDKQKPTSSEPTKKAKKKNKGKETLEKQNMQVQTNEIKVNLAIDQSFRNDVAKLKEAKTKIAPPTKKQQRKEKERKEEKNVTRSAIDNDIIDIPSLKLPPGITITKVNGPLNHRKTNVQSNEYPDVPVSKSGVIVVDTEKLMNSQSGKRKKKKKKTAGDPESSNDQSQNSSSNVNNAKQEPRVQIRASTSANDSGRMVKLKNPNFNSLQSKMMPSDDAHLMNMNEQATISKGANGMVTIRRQRHVGFYASNESSISEYLASSATPTQREPIRTPWQMPDTSMAALSSEENKMMGTIAQWPSDQSDAKINASSVLQSLPGIEITRVKTGSPVAANEYVEAPADVSIIRTVRLGDATPTN